ncbi:MAG: mechanosensitive ion channel [Angelakisella sp.]
MVTMSNLLVEGWGAALLTKIVTLLLTLVLGLVAIKVLLYLEEKLLRRSPITSTAVPFILSVSKIFGYVLLGISVATSLHIVEISSIVTALGAVGLAVSLAVKDSLSNLMGGCLLILTKAFKLGDTIEVDGATGTVAEIGLIHTVLVGPDRKIFIPNGKVTNAKVTNFTAAQS